jgi:Raf kinase inhibitor-like YbhB/YbcL family protein
MRFATLGSALALGLAPFAAQAQGMRLDSPDIAGGRMVANKHVFNGFGCKGENVSPALRWQNPPKGTQSFALLVHDPDAPTGGAGWWHWAVVNIPAAATGLEQGAGAADGAKLPAGSRQVNTDFGAPGYGGPCPPPGDKPHRYNFTLYALKVDKLDLPPTATASLAGYMVNANALGKTSLQALYRQSK